MESPKFESSLETNEAIQVESKILSASSLLERIYQGNSIPQDTRFLPIDEGGVFRYFYPRDVGDSGLRRVHKVYPVVESKNTIVALSELEQDPHNAKNFWIKFISVDPAYQNKGNASKLVSVIFKFAKDNNYTLEPSFYSEQGLEKLKTVIERTALETGVKIIDRNIN